MPKAKKTPAPVVQTPAVAAPAPAAKPAPEPEPTTVYDEDAVRAELEAEMIAGAELELHEDPGPAADARPSGVAPAPATKATAEKGKQSLAEYVTERVARSAKSAVKVAGWMKPWKGEQVESARAKVEAAAKLLAEAGELLLHAPADQLRGRTGGGLARKIDVGASVTIKAPMVSKYAKLLGEADASAPLKVFTLNGQKLGVRTASGAVIFIARVDVEA